ncbi:hypothetical protein D3Z36_16945 [Lachnospiraceae bacterium]|nr:hypothetical protein [Lachnospiraceae bacterium]
MSYKNIAIINIKAAFPNNIDKVWKVVTDFQNSDWRSNVSRTEVLNVKQFVEYTKDGYATAFTVTVTDPYKSFEFDMENSDNRSPSRHTIQLG